MDDKLAESGDSRRTIVTVLGIPLTAAAQSWQFVPPKLVIGIFIALVTRGHEPVMTWFVWGLIYGALLLTVLALHILGHILSSKLVFPSMTEAHITPVLIQTLYQNDTPDIPVRTHLIRSIGGPVMNILVGIAALFVSRVSGSHAILAFSAADFAIAFLVLLPFPSVDGEVIWREIRRSVRQ
jgi:hypothetical protein